MTVEWNAIRENGYLVLGDPKYGSDKHKLPNRVLVLTEAEAVKLIEEHGYSIRVEALDADPRGTLIRKDLFVDGHRLT